MIQEKRKRTFLLKGLCLNYSMEIKMQPEDSGLWVIKQTGLSNKHRAGLVSQRTNESGGGGDKNGNSD